MKCCDSYCWSEGYECITDINKREFEAQEKEHAIKALEYSTNNTYLDSKIDRCNFRQTQNSF